MLDLKLLQKNPEFVAKQLARRHSAIDINVFTELDKRRRSILQEVESLKAERNKISSEVGAIRKSGGDASELMAKSVEIGKKIAELDTEASDAQTAQSQWMLTVPNNPDSDVPDGIDERDNPELHRWGDEFKLHFNAKPHWELGEALGLIDFDRAAKLAGARFAVLKGWIARLERALMNFYLDFHASEGRIEFGVPFMVNRATMTGTGQLPKFEEDLFKVNDPRDFFLIPTAEVPLTNLHSGEILDESQLPLRYCAATPCFRSEAGAAGKDTRGLIRQHQFIKVEMVYLAKPDDSERCLEEMRRSAETLLELLKLPYRTITLCTGDMGFSAAKTYDVEVWLPGQNTYREISSCSNCRDFQARRANIRFKPTGGGKPEFVHTLNGSGLPTGRSLVAVIENYQREDGSIGIPDVLQPYMGGIKEIPAK